MAVTIDGTTGITDVDGGEFLSDADYNVITNTVNVDNIVINGNFNIWQRGVSGSGLGYVAADRWGNQFIGGTVTQSRFNFGMGEYLAASLPTYGLRQTVSGQSLTSHYAITEQRIEDVRSYAGQTITVLGWARRTSGVTGNMSIEIAQCFGTGSPSPNVNIPAPAAVSLTDAWLPFAAVINVPSTIGKTIGPNNNDYLALIFWISGGSDYAARTNNLGLQNIAVDLWGIHIKLGAHAASAANLYRPRDPGTELALCQRYYEKSYNIDTVPGTNTGLGASVEDVYIASAMPVRVRFAVSKRSTAPAIGVFDVVGTSSRFTAFTPSQQNGQSLTAVDNLGNSGFKVFLSLTGMTRATFHWTADAEL